MNSKFITGKTGVGKTYLAKKLLDEEHDRWPKIRQEFSDPNWAVESQHFKYYSCPKIVIEAKIAKRALEIIQEASRAHIVVLDDLGMNKISNYNPDIIYIIINERLEKGKTTIVTSNLSIDDISDHIDDRLASRLSSFEQIEITGKDRRAQ